MTPPPRYHCILLCTLLLVPLFALAGPADTQAANERVKLAIKKAKDVVLACKLFAMDNGGRFPTRLSELVPDYLPRISDLQSPLCPKEPIGYAYVGGLDHGPRTVTLITKTMAAGDEVVLVYNNMETELLFGRESAK